MPAHNRGLRDELAELRTAMRQASALTSLDDQPLMVLTARKGAQGGWAAAQDDLARLSTNSAHRTLDDATHSMLVEDRATAAQPSRAIPAVVEAARTGQRLAASGS